MLGHESWKASHPAEVLMQSQCGIRAAKFFVTACRNKQNKSRCIFWLNKRYLFAPKISKGYTHIIMFIIDYHTRTLEKIHVLTPTKFYAADSLCLRSAVFHIEVDALTVLRAFPRMITMTVTSSWYFLLLPTGILINCSAVKAGKA